MDLTWTLIFVILFGQKVEAYSDGNIGCHVLECKDIVYQADLNNNSGYVCKRYCFVGHGINYAGTSNNMCYCINNFNERNVTDSGCTFPCPGNSDEFCGGINKLTLYDARRTTTAITSQESTTTSTNKSVTSTVSSTSKSNTVAIFAAVIPMFGLITAVAGSDCHSEVLSSPYVAILVFSVLVVVSIFLLIVMLRRHLGMREKRRNKSKARVNPTNVVNASNVDLSENGIIAHRQDNVDTDYDTTITFHHNPRAASSIEGDYSRLRDTEVPLEDPTYSHIRNQLQGACAILEADYSHLGRNETSTKWTNMEENNLSASDYDNVQFNLSCNVASFRTYNDNVYDKLHNKT